jgi:hypothetical protein
MRREAAQREVSKLLIHYSQIQNLRKKGPTAWRTHMSPSCWRLWPATSLLPRSLVNRPHLSSSGKSSWLQIRRSGLDSRRYHILWEAVGLERGPLSLVSTIDDLLGRKSSGSGLESREYGRRGRHAAHVAPSISKKLTLALPTSGGGSVGIVRSRTQATPFSSYFQHLHNLTAYVVCKEWVRIHTAPTLRPTISTTSPYLPKAHINVIVLIPSVSSGLTWKFRTWPNVKIRVWHFKYRLHSG